MKKYFLSFLFLSLFFIGNVSAAQLLNPEKINTDIVITGDGKVSIKNAKIMQFVGNTIYIRLMWEETFIRMTLKTGPNTKMTKKYGEVTSVSDMKIGDRLNIDGTLEPGPDSLTVVTSSIKNLSDERGQYKLSGTITGNASGVKGFIMKTDDGKTITLSLENNSKIIKGNRNITFYDIKVGDKIENAEGTFNFGTNIFSVSNMKVYVNLSQFSYRNFQGILKKISGTSLPVVLTITIDGKDYTVKLSEGSLVWNSKKQNTQFSRFVAGDEVRLWGAIPEGDDLYYINAEIIRNISL